MHDIDPCENAGESKPPKLSLYNFSSCNRLLVYTHALSVYLINVSIKCIFHCQASQRGTIRVPEVLMLP